MSKFLNYGTDRLNSSLKTIRRKTSKLNSEDFIISDCDNQLQFIEDSYRGIDCTQEEVKKAKEKQLGIIRKKKHVEIQHKLHLLFEKINDIRQLERIIQDRRGKRVKQRTRKEEQERKVIIERVLREKIPLRQKQDRLKDILDEKEMKRLIFCIEDIDDIENHMVNDDEEAVKFGVDNRWRARFFRRPKDLIFLRLSLCMKITHTVWKCGDFESSISLFRNGKISDKDGEGIFNYKKGTFTYKGIMYNILPEFPDLIERAFDAHEGLFEKWESFDKLFNINDVKCIPDKDKCVSLEPRICMSHRDIIDDMDYHCLRPHYYFPTYAYIRSGNVPKF